MEISGSIQEQKHKRRGRTISIVIHIGILLLALLPILTFPDPPPGQEGILVNLGIPDVGQGDENAPESQPEEAAAAEAEEEVVEEEPEVEEPEPEPEPEPKREKKPEPKEKKVVQTEDPEAIALKKRREREKREKAEEEKRKKDEARKKAEADRKRKAAEAKAKAEADRKKKQADAKKFGESLGLGGLGSGKGNTGKEGNQGDPNGDPNASRLEGISTGSGTVGGGLGSRGVIRFPKVTDNSQKEGTVVIKVCVDGNGKVTSASYTQRGSSTSDRQLIRLAESNAKTWRFNKGSMDKQCGTISYRFKVK